MILASFELSDIIRVPFGWLLGLLYQLTTNYGVALILFSILVKLILMPTTVKSKRSMMKMSRLTPQIQYLQKKYENDQQKLQLEMQALYKREGVSMGGGCLWSLLPLFILIPLYNVVRMPITYILQERDAADALVTAVMAVKPELFKGANEYYHQMIAGANLTPEIVATVEGVKNVVRAGAGVNFTFLGIDLSLFPQYKTIFTGAFWSSWNTVGAFLLPILATAGQFLTMFISQKVNDSLVTNEKGIKDKEAAKNSEANKTGKVMMYTMPLMTLFIGYSMPAAMSLYWLIQGLVGTVLDNILTISLRKEYDAEDAIRLQKAMEEELAELEKERKRAERRAENPDGITENTSKKKLQQKQKAEQEAAKAAARKEYNAKKGIFEEEEEGPVAMSGIPERPYCKGRNYDPNRYASDATEE